jgi:hypothetical protein
MKAIYAFCLLCIYMTSASALTLNDIQGKYRVSHPEAPVENIVTIKADGTVSLIEKSAIFGEFKCEAKAKIKGEKVISEMICENGADFVQTINLAGITNFNNFKAPVYSSLYEAEFEMIFERL